MSVRVGLSSQDSNLVHQQVKARLDALGLVLKPDNTIDAESAKNVQGGMAAVAALAKDGIIDADALAQLRRQSSLVGRALGRDAPISEKATQNWRALGLELDGIAQTMNALVREISSTGELSMSQLGRLDARLATLQKALDRAGYGSAPVDTDRLARTAPETLRDVAASGRTLTDASVALSQRLSSFRSAMLDALEQVNGPKYRLEARPGGYDVIARPGLLTRLQTNALAGSLVAAQRALDVTARLGEMLSMPIGRAPLALASGPTPPAAGSAALTHRRALLHLEAALGPGPGLFPGAIGDAFAARVEPSVRPAFVAVLEAARVELATTKQVSDAYGQTHGWPDEAAGASPLVPRPVFRKVLADAQALVDSILSKYPVADRTPATLDANLREDVAPRDAHLARAARALFEASSVAPPARAAYGATI